MSMVKQKEEETWGIERVREYAEEHKKYAGFMFGGLVKDVKTLGVTGRFLEIGAGPGFLAVMLAREYPDITVTAADISPAMATVADEYIAENGLQDRIDYVVGDVYDRDFMRGLGRFDFVYTTFCLHDWNPPDDAVRNLWEAVEDNGVLYIHDFRNIGFLRCLPIKDEGFKSMKRSYSPKEIRSVFKRTGITDCTIRKGFPFIFLSVIARR